MNCLVVRYILVPLQVSLPLLPTIQRKNFIYEHLSGQLYF